MGLSMADTMAFAWYVLDALTHIIMEGSYLFFAVGVQGGARSVAERITASGSTTMWDQTLLAFANIWVEYGKADVRWEGNDETVAALEALTVFVGGPLALALAYGTWYGKAWRHPLQIVLATAELYGGWMTFCPEWLTGSPNLRTHHPMLLFELWFMNGVWVLIPLILLVESFVKLTRAASGVKLAHAPDALSSFWHYAIGITLLVYGVSVPLILATMDPDTPW